jgi:hypothetical protein
MVVTAALLSLAALAVGAEPQTAPPEQAPAYTLSGVRRAVASSAEPAEAPKAPPAAIARSAGQQVVVDTRTDGTVIPIQRPDHLASVSLAPTGNSWHQEFMAMTQSKDGAAPYALMTNSDRAIGVASGLAFALAIQEALSLVEHAAGAVKGWKANRLRHEIDDERLAVEQMLKSGQLSDPAIVKKAP